MLSEAEAAAIDALLELLPVFEEKSFVPALWPPRFTFDEQGQRIAHMPYPDYHPAVEEFRRRCPGFAATSDSRAAVSPESSPKPLEFFESVGTEAIRRYFLYVLRGERMCDGHIAGEFESGRVLGALKRLYTLKNGAEEMAPP